MKLFDDFIGCKGYEKKLKYHVKKRIKRWSMLWYWQVYQIVQVIKWKVKISLSQ